MDYRHCSFVRTEAKEKKKQKTYLTYLTFILWYEAHTPYTMYYNVCAHVYVKKSFLIILH